MATVIYCNKKELYLAPTELIEAQDHFRQRAPAEWKKDLGYAAAFQKIYGWSAWMDAREYDYVPENRDRAYVREPAHIIEIKSADPSPTPAPATDPLIAQIAEDVAQILVIVKDLESRA